MKFGEKIRASREKKGLSKQDFAQIVGITSTYVTKVEEGKSSFRAIEETKGGRIIKEI